MKIIKKFSDLSKKKFNIIYVFTIAAISACFSGKTSYFNWFVMTTIMYNVIANNFVQTVGTFVTSSKNISKLNLFLYLAIIFIFNVLLAWKSYDGRIHRGFLEEIEYKDSIRYSALLIPIILNLLTRFRIPISTTFLTLPLFSKTYNLTNIISKAFSGYFVSFIISFIIWNLVYEKYKKHLKSNDNYEFWKAIQYISIGVLWYSWLSTCMSSFLVFLPRKFNIRHLILFLFIGILLLVIIAKNGICNMEEIVEEKSDLKNIRSSVIFNITYSILLLVFKFNDRINITTTWLFLGLLDGRELSITNSKATAMSGNSYKTCLKKIFRDLYLSIIGIFVSLIFSNIIKI